MKFLIVFSIMTIILTSGCVGGCFGNYRIEDLTVEPQPQCLDIRANNCNDGVLEIENNCSEPVTIGGLTMEGRNVWETGKISPSYTSIDAARTSSGEIVVNYTEGNFGFYKPTVDDHISLNGMVGETPIRISYVKSNHSSEKQLSDIAYILIIIGTVFIIYLLPALIVIVAMFLIVRFIYRRLKNKKR